MSKIKAPVCLVDNDVSTRDLIEKILRDEEIPLESYQSAAEYLARECDGNAEPPACLILEVDLPGLCGLELQRELARNGSNLPIIFLSRTADIHTSVRAMKAGAIEFLTKPLDPALLCHAIHEAMLARESAWRTDAPSPAGAGSIIGGGSAWRSALRQIAMVAPTDATVLIQGETGTGKELMAHEIHELSRRRERPLVRVNCASVPKELFESEFFGHARGSFTGAFRDRAGRFEVADGGTLFLDEIGEVPLELQSKLLRALQEKQFERVGEDKTRKANVRIIAATNRNLKQEVAAGHFREDLYYRLNVFPVEVAPLRERLEDIPLLASYFVDKLTRELKCQKPRLTAAGVTTLQCYHWPGNIRELRNVIERSIIMARGKALDFDLPMTATGASPTVPAHLPPKAEPAQPEYLTEPELQRRQRENLRIVLQKAGWKIKGADGAAELLRVKPTTLVSRIKKLGLKRENFPSLVPAF